MSMMSSARPARTTGRAPRSLLRFGALLVVLAGLVYLVLQAAQGEPDVQTMNGGAQGHTNVISALAFSPDGRFLVSGGESGNVKIWDLRTGTVVRRVWGGTRMVNSVAVSPDASLIASGNEDTSVCRWEAATGLLLTPRGWHHAYAKEVAFSPNGTTLASAGLDKTVRLWDAHNGKPTRVLTGSKDWASAVTFSPDGRLLASGDRVSARLWDARTGRLLRVLPGPVGQAAVHWCSFSPNGKTLATGGSYSGGAMLWDVASGVRKNVLAIPGIHAGTFSPDGKRLVFATPNNIELWDVRTNRRARALRGTDLRDRLRLPAGLLRLFPFLVPPARERIGPIALSTDGHFLAYASGRNVKLWRLPRR